MGLGTNLVIVYGSALNILYPFFSTLVPHLYTIARTLLVLYILARSILLFKERNACGRASSPGREERMKDRRQSYSHPALQLPVFRTSQANEFSYTRNLSGSKELKLDGERPVLGREKFARLGTGENNTILKKGREHPENRYDGDLYLCPAVRCPISLRTPRSTAYVLRRALQTTPVILVCYLCVCNRSSTWTINCVLNIAVCHRTVRV